MTVTLDKNVEDFLASPRKLFIDGQWTDAASGKTFETPNPATGETLARGRRGRRRGHQPRGPGRAQGLRRRPVDQDDAVRARTHHLEDRRPDRRAPRRAGRSSSRSTTANRSRSPAPPTCRCRRTCSATWPAGPPRSKATRSVSSVPYMPGANFHCLHAARAGRRRRADHPVELPAADGRVEARARARHRLHRRAQAGRADAAHRAAAGRDHRRGRPARRSGQHRYRLRRHRWRSAGRAPRCRQGRLHRLHRGRQADRAGRHGQPEEGLAGTRRQEPQHRLRRCRPEPRSRARPTRSSSTTGSAACAGSRLYVEQDSFDEVVDGVAEIAKNIKLGPGIDPDTQMGPLVSRGAVRPGHRLPRVRPGGRRHRLAGGDALGDRGYFVEPTVLTDAHPRHEGRPRGDLRPGSRALNRSATWTRSPRRQRHHLRPRRRDLDQGHLQGASHLAKKLQGRHRLGQLLQRLRRRPALWRIQAVRLGPRDGPRGARKLH